MKVCSYCGRENDAAVTHCFECGTEFVAERADMAPVLRWGRTWIKAACGYIAVILSGELRRWWTILTPHPPSPYWLRRAGPRPLPVEGRGSRASLRLDLHFRFERSPVDDLLDHGSQDDIPVLHAGMIALQINGAGP